ncbi:hypothetical protein LWI29_012821 [Acer saccharum]|uniref:RNase H type-1 domain-containing protein n=1 Tax=Acer saccharum TaxID=4024 RepID=A0AA39RCV2_ACESA|nr:hypothetical protein LWI29_012821 [Acer saccharum]
MHILLNIVECCSEKPTKKIQRIDKWSPPLANSLYFNIDGSVMGSLGPAGIGGVLCDNMGKILFVFSSHAGVQYVILAELLAILRACELFGSRQELALRPLTVISDSKIAVGWVLGCLSGNNSHNQVIEDIRSWLGSFSSALVEFRSRSSNSFADTLEKKGLSSGVEDLWWSV